MGTKSLVESYTNKPFGKVFEALQWLEAKLDPMFQATPDDPFPKQRKLGGGGLTLRQRQMIESLLAKATPVAEIAKKVGCSLMSVYRHRAKPDK